MEYSTLEGKLVMPEYGRNVQRMVEYACTIEDRDERNQCVEAIIHTMENIFPYLKDETQRHKVYDHLAIMSDFKLDIDYPYELPDREQIHYHPEQLKYADRPVRMRCYGRMVEQMVAAAIDEQDEEKKHDLIISLANRMKQNYLYWNKDHVEPETIMEDIKILSKGRLSTDFEGFEIKQRRTLLGIENVSNKQNFIKKKK